MFGESAIDKAIRGALKATQQRLGEIVRRHHSEVEGVGKSLAQRLVAEAGLTGPAAASRPSPARPAAARRRRRTPGAPTRRG